MDVVEVRGEGNVEGKDGCVGRSNDPSGGVKPSGLVSSKSSLRVVEVLCSDPSRVGGESGALMRPCSSVYSTSG